MTLKALIWDVDGTLAETERDGHRVAFNRAFEALGLSWQWGSDHYGSLLEVTGGYERLMHDMARRPDAPGAPEARERLARELHKLKNGFYAEAVTRGAIALRPGVRELFDDAHAAGLPMAIATTTSRSNVDALLESHFGAGWLSRFAAVLTAEDAPVKKPDPQVYLRALERLNVAAAEALAVEDSSPGVRAARAARVPVIVTRSVYFADADVGGALAVGPSLGQAEGWQPAAAAARGRVDLAQLRRWHATLS